MAVMQKKRPPRHPKMLLHHGRTHIKSECHRFKHQSHQICAETSNCDSGDLQDGQGSKFCPSRWDWLFNVWRSAGLSAPMMLREISHVTACFDASGEITCLCRVSSCLLTGQIVHHRLKQQSGRCVIKKLERPRNYPSDKTAESLEQLWYLHHDRTILSLSCGFHPYH